MFLRNSWTFKCNSHLVKKMKFQENLNTVVIYNSNTDLGGTSNLLIFNVIVMYYIDLGRTLNFTHCTWDTCILRETQCNSNVLHWLRQNSQLSRIACETHAFYAKLTLTHFVSSFSRIYKLNEADARFYHESFNCTICGPHSITRKFSGASTYKSKFQKSTNC